MSAVPRLARSLTGVLSSVPTRRELEVLDAVTRPHATYASAALELGIKPSTVKQTLRTLFLRLNVRSQAQAVRAVGNIWSARCVLTEDESIEQRNGE